MAAYAAVASLLNNVEQLSNHSHFSISFNNIQIQTLVEKSRSLLDFIEAINYVGGNKEVEDLEREIARSAHAAEDVIESHIADRIHAYKDVVVDQILDEEATSLFLLNVEKNVRDVDALIVNASELLKAKGASKELEEQRPTHSTPTPTPLVESGDNNAAMVGLEDDLLQLLHELTGHHLSRHTISIVGMGGIGKTTLAKTVYANPLVIEHFEIRAWATLSQQYNEVEIFSQLLSCLGQSSSGSVDELGVSLHKTLIGRRYLVVLDDIWSVEAWDKVRRYFPDDGNSSRVILTTRLSNLATVCGSSCLKMDLLDEDKSWKLFCEKTHFPYKDDPPQMERVGKDIVRLCKGLALSIVVIGGLLLKSPRTVGFWENVVKSIKSLDAESSEKQESLDVISSSYNHLPPHLKPCFLYMGVFKEDSVTRVSTISRLWVAEGFIRPDGVRVLEEIAEDYLNDLVDRNLIIVRSRRYNGKIGSFSIHDLLRDLCIKVAEQQDFFQARGNKNVGTSDGRIVCNILDQYQSNIEFPLTRSLLMSTRNNSLVGETECKLLRVLSNAYCPKTSPDTIFYENVNLRYLTYANLYDPHSTLKLPSTLSLIWNLQTLIISPLFGFPFIVAPPEIWKMRQLKHLQCTKIYLPSNGQDGSLSILENLQTLTKAVNLGLSEEVCKMIPKIKKLRLLYDRKFPGYNASLIECLCNMESLHKLESLKMETKIRLASRMKKLPKLAFPSSLLKLSLKGVELGNWNDLRVVGLLPQLQVLNLEQLDVKDYESRWSPAKGEYRSLRLLKIDMCLLYLWEIAEWSHFPVLEKLILSRLEVLREIPPAVGEIPTLELIRVDNCTEISLAISAMKIKEDQLETQVEDDDDALRIEVWFCYKSEIESFKERVETEQLTLDHIHLEERIK